MCPSKAAVTTEPRKQVRGWYFVMVVVLAAIAATPWLLGPRCPDRIVIATGSEQGASERSET